MSQESQLLLYKLDVYDALHVCCCGAYGMLRRMCKALESLYEHSNVLEETKQVCTTREVQDLTADRQRTVRTFTGRQWHRSLFTLVQCNSVVLLCWAQSGPDLLSPDRAVKLSDSAFVNAVLRLTSEDVLICEAVPAVYYCKIPTAIPIHTIRL